MQMFSAVFIWRNIFSQYFMPAVSAWNLGVIFLFYNNLNFTENVFQICQTCYYHIRDLWCIHQHLPRSAAKLLQLC